MEKYFNDLIDELKELDEVDAIMLGGSKALNNEDDLSDYDVYVYYNKKIEQNKRKDILEKYLKYYEIANKFFEEEDDGILKDGKEIELIYRNKNFIEEQFNNIFKENKVSFGYSTCMIHNILKSKTIYDKDNIVEKYREKYKVYPKELKKNIILNNMKLLDDQMPSLSYQIIKALKRKDIISINHRITEYLAIYFDILFALNEEYHSGEKRLLEFLDKLEIKPIGAKENIEYLLFNAFTKSDEMIEVVDNISNNMNKLVKEIYPEYKKSNYRKFKKTENN